MSRHKEIMSRPTSVISLDIMSQHKEICRDLLPCDFKWANFTLCHDKEYRYRNKVETMSQHRIVCHDNLMTLLKISQLTSFNKHTNNSMQYLHLTQIILVKTNIIIKEPQFKNEQSHFIYSLNIIQHAYQQGIKGMSTTKLFKISYSLKKITFPQTSTIHSH